MVDKYYEDRELNLKLLGFNTYKSYLESDIWRTIKKRAFIKHGVQCRLCFRVATNMHHLLYDRATLRGETLDNLVPLCPTCHKKVELDDNGVKRSFIDSSKEYLRIFNRDRARRKKLVITKNPLQQGNPEIGLRHKTKHLVRSQLRKVSRSK